MLNKAEMNTDYMRPNPDYLALGHVTKDLTGDGKTITPGGTVLYSAITAQRLGLQAAIVTSCSSKDSYLLQEVQDAGVWVHVMDSPYTTTFYNVYDEDGKRTQVVGAQASRVWMRDVPVGWRNAPIVHLGPVAQELPDHMPSRFTDCLLGITPQGWMRSWDNAGLVKHSVWPIPPELTGLPANTFLCLSIEDLGYDPGLMESYVSLAPLVAITHGVHGAYVYSTDESAVLPSCKAEVVDATGAGDVFAAALFVKYHETADPFLSARFAHAAAAFAIEGQGASSIPDRAAVEHRLATEPQRRDR